MSTGNAHCERFWLWSKRNELLLSNWRIDSSFAHRKYCRKWMCCLLYNRFEQLWRLWWEPFSISQLNSLIFRWCISSQWKSFGKYWNRWKYWNRGQYWNRGKYWNRRKYWNRGKYWNRWRRWFQYDNEFDWSYWRWIFLSRSSIFGNGHCHIRFTISDSLNSVIRESDFS